MTVIPPGWRSAICSPTYPWSVLPNSPPICVGAINGNGTRIQFLSERLRLTRFATLRQRIADWLVRQAQSNLEGLPAQPLKVLKAHVEPSFEKMADLMGVERPSLSRELSHMRDDGLIEIEGRMIYLKNYETLKRIRHGKHEKG